jgi:carbohydrate kinase (thermoresistant glucokinase family)
MLAQQTGWRYIEGDDYHPADNKAKMASGIPLNDDDRHPWLQRLAKLIDRHLQMDRSVVLSCSALKQVYREQLMRSPEQVRFVYLKGAYEPIRARLEQRPNHFVGQELLQSQFNDLEPPKEALNLSIAESPEQIVKRIMKELKLTPELRETEILLDDLIFPEAPRWRNDWLWFTDQHARQVRRVNLRGESEILAALDDLPGGLGWLPDGRLLVVSMTKRQILTLTDSEPELYADLGSLASFHCNDMLVDAQGRSYVGNFGFDLHGGGKQTPAELILVEPGGQPRLVSKKLIFPNGCALSQNGRTLLVAETFASHITAFNVEADGSLSHRRVWAELNGAYPDGIALDDQNNLWVATPNLSRLLLVKEGGEIVREVQSIGDPYACMLGGERGDTLFITSSESDTPEEAKVLHSGRIEILKL